MKGRGGRSGRGARLTLSLVQVPVTFVDIAVYFSEDEWKNLDEWQKELYNNLVKENYKTLMSLDAEGTAPKPDAPSQAEPREEPCVWEQRDPGDREILMDPDAGDGS